MKAYAEAPTPPTPSPNDVPSAARASRLNLPQWLTAFFLGVIAACLMLRWDQPFGAVALAQPTSLAGARGVFAFTGQVGKDRFGVFMVDVDQGTLWCYELNEKKNLNLLAGRSWRYDRYLENFNAGDLTLKEVEKLVEEERNKRLQGAGSPPPSPPKPQQNVAPNDNDAAVEP